MKLVTILLHARSCFRFVVGKTHEERLAGKLRYIKVIHDNESCGCGQRQIEAVKIAQLTIQDREACIKQLRSCHCHESWQMTPQSALVLWLWDGRLGKLSI